MFDVVAYKLPNGDVPFDNYLKELSRPSASSKKGRSIREKEAAKIRVYVNRLSEMGSYEMSRPGWAKKLNGIWELRPKPHRIFYFWDGDEKKYVLLHGFRKKTPKTPQNEIERAERYRHEHLVQKEKRGQHE